MTPGAGLSQSTVCAAVFSVLTEALLRRAECVCEDTKVEKIYSFSFHFFTDQKTKKSVSTHARIGSVYLNGRKSDLNKEPKRQNSVVTSSHNITSHSNETNVTVC